MAAILTPSDIGTRLAHDHDQIIAGINYARLFQDNSLPFEGLDLENRKRAFGVYAKTLMDLGEGKRQPYYAEEYARDLVVFQLSKLLAGEHLAQMIQTQKAGDLLLPCQRAWDKGADDHPSKIQRQKKLNKIFQITQDNYASTGGQRLALLGFRLIGQASHYNLTPFTRWQPEGKDEALRRLSFFLRMPTKRKKTEVALEKGACGKDLAAAWKALHMEAYLHKPFKPQNEERLLNFASMSVAGWLARHHPNALVQIIDKELWPSIEAWKYIKDEDDLLQSGKAFVVRSSLEKSTECQGQTTTPGKRKL